MNASKDVVENEVAESCCSHSHVQTTRGRRLFSHQIHSLSSPSPWPISDSLQYLFVSTYQVRQFCDDISAIVLHVDTFEMSPFI